MSWSDPCRNCGQHRADCDCGDWNGYEKERKLEQKIADMYDDEFKDKEVNKDNVLNFIKRVRLFAL